MLLQIISFELRTALNSKVTYIYFAIMFALTFMFINAVGGAFPAIQIGIAGDNIKLNSPMVIDLVLSFFSFLGIFITAGIVSNIIYKDFKYDSLSLTFTTQVSKFNYLMGRYIAALLINILVFLGPAFGILIGSEMPYLNSDMFGDVIPMAYINTYLSRIIPNLFFITALFFTLTLLLRNIVINWFVIIGLYVLYAVGGRMINDLDNQTLAALLDPFGMASSMKVSSNFSADEANTQSIPLESVYLLNRILWVIIGAITLIIGYFRFNFSFDIDKIKIRKKKAKSFENNIQTNGSENYIDRQINTVQPNYGLKHNLLSFISLFRREFKGLITNIYFILIMIIGIGFLITTSQAIGKIFDTVTYPVTYQVIEILGGTFNLFVMIIIILFSGEMVWQSRSLKVHETENILPVNNWHLLGSKITALITIIFSMLSMLVITGVIVQAFNGYYNFEIGLYIKSVLGLQFTYYILIILFAFFVQILVNHKFLGYTLIIIYYIWDAQFAGAVLQNNLFIYGEGPSYMYSDMNGYSEGMWVVLIYRFYWFAFAVLLSILANRFLVRGTEEGFIKRWKNFKTSWSKIRIAIPISLIVFLTTSGFIFYNTNILNDFNRSYEFEKRMVEYERKYKKYENITQPRITAVDTKFDLYPEGGDAHIDGQYILKNTSNTPLDTLILSMDRETVKSVNVDGGYSTLIEDDMQKFHMYKLNQRLQPDDSTVLTFEFDYKVKGFTNNGVRVMTNKNGTFLNSGILPSLGYNSGAELNSKKLRKKHDLPKKEIENRRDDVEAVKNNFITDDADFVRLSVQISTSEDQTALAPGYCKKQWTENGRNYFQYASDVPVINFFAVLSAKYELVEDKWTPEDSAQNPVAIKVYYHMGHEYNIQNIIDGVKASLSYYSKNYCEYPHPELKIIEFPRYGSFAQSFPAMIPFSEGLGFIADLREKEDEDIDFADLKIDYPFWVTAHEMAHQWLAHHIIAAETEGAQMLMESVTQFSSLKVIEDSFGKEKLKKFLRQEMNRYAMSRQNENFEEQPLATVWGHQSAIYYQKGIIVLNALNDYLGDDKLVKVTSDFINKYKFKGAPYATTAEYIDEIRKVTPDSLQYIVTDWMEKITFYDFEVKEATYERNEKLEYFMNLTLEANKTYSDGLGKATQAEMNDYVEIGVYNSKEKEIYLEKVKLNSDENKLRIKLGRKPSKVVIDPWYKLITKDVDQASMKVVKDYN
ncbi:MAG: hypothetical protein HOB05_15700 [Bacteroidetes bacterium]|nr:hypothetical protein [Bacteroidota bacterium]MBT6687760.1 hypothetical protein [Bacteroidota bacterium]MBT7143394.1 hypothetical protein [Bacteroidota bacterium]